MAPNTRQPTDVALFEGLLASKPSKREGGPLATFASVGVHAVIIIGLIYIPSRASANASDDQPILVSLAEEKPVVIPPPLYVPPPSHLMTTVAAPQGFTMLAVPDLVPADISLPQPGVTINPSDFEPVGVAGGNASGTGHATVADVAAQPFMTPMDVPPKLLNRGEVTTAISRNYPSMMREAGIGGTTRVWFYIDATGRSVKQMVKTGSGYAVLDSAALHVAPVMRFAPAMAQARPIPVWVAIDIVFAIK